MASHKEANDRIMYSSINQVFQRKNSETITVLTSDTEIITVILGRQFLSIRSMKDWERHYALPFPSFTLSVDVTLLNHLHKEPVVCYLDVFSNTRKS